MPENTHDNQPTSITEDWLAFARREIPTHVPPAVREAIKEGFYAGAAGGMLLTMRATLGADPEADLNRIRNEILAFNEDCLTRDRARQAMGVV